MYVSTCARQGIVESDIYDAHGRFMNSLELQGRLLLPNKAYPCRSRGCARAV